MREKKFLRAVCFCFAVAVFFNPVKQISYASVSAESQPVEQEGEYAQMTEGSQEEVLSEKEKALRNEAEGPIDTYEEESGTASGWHGNSNQQKSGDEYLPENEPDYEGNDQIGPQDEYGPDQQYEEDGKPGEPDDEYAPGQEYDEQQPYEEPAPEPGLDENQPIQIKEKKQKKIPAHTSGW